MQGEKRRDATVGILGPFGTYSHEAARNYFGDSVQYQEIETIKGVFDSLAAGSIDFGVVPQENTIFGSVIETYDALRYTGDEIVSGETSLRIDHCLLVKAGVKLADIRRVLSHEQALGQCIQFVETYLPLACTETTTSTAAAARALSERPDDCAAIASRVCAILFDGLEVLKSAIQKEKMNYTRFYVLSRNSSEIPPSNISRSSPGQALFRVFTEPATPPDSQPSISDVLRCLGKLDITRIDRRPSSGDVPFRNIYFLEVRGAKEGRDHTLFEAEWKATLETFVNKVRALGMGIDLIGNW